MRRKFKVLSATLTCYSVVKNIALVHIDLARFDAEIVPGSFSRTATESYASNLLGGVYAQRDDVQCCGQYGYYDCWYRAGRSVSGERVCATGPEMADCEAHSGQSEHSKALANFPRTLEIFDMAGVVDPFLERANRVTSVSVATHGRRLAHLHFAPEESPYPSVAMVPQDVTERLLVEELRRKGRAVEYETIFVSAFAWDQGVNVTLERKGEPIDLDFLRRRMRWRSQRGAASAQLAFEGAEYDDTYMLADVETNEAFPADELQLCPSELGPVAIFPMSSTRRRIVANIDKAEGDAPSLELVRKVVAQRAPSGIEIPALHWSSYFRIHHRQAARLRVGRFFIAGDAAHIHSPFGGQGMNTGLHDVWNLAWKLDLVLRGHGGEELLESYRAERRPVIKQVIETTDLLTKAMGTPSKLAQLLRDTLIPMVSHLAPFQHAFVQRLSESM